VSRFALVVSTLLLLLVCSACADPGERAPDAGGGSGVATIRGTVVRGPTCPVETDDSPCPDAPAADVEVQALSDGVVEARATTDAQGRFSMEVPPGSYLVRAREAEGRPGMLAKPSVVTVGEGDVAEVTVLIDTGIRAPLGDGAG
jgi:hypothetical protein